MPEISVIIPAYNRAHCLVRTLESVFAQTFTGYEVVVIDDGSTDHTREVMKPWLDRVRYVYQENRGLGATRNRGVEMAKAEWIAFLDSDDLWHPDKLAVQMEAVRRSPELAVHVTNATIFREHLGEETDLYALSGFTPGADGISRLNRPLIPCVSKGLGWMQCALARRSTFLAAGPFDPALRVFMDFELSARLAMQGPWEANHRPLVRILRQDEGEVASISSQSGTSAGRRELAEVYRRMGSMRGLDADETVFLRRRLSDARSALGVHLLEQGPLPEARRVFRQAFQDCRRPATLAKMCAAHSPGPVRRGLFRYFRS